MLGQRRFGVEQSADVAEIAAHPVQEDGGWSAGIGRGQVIHGHLQPLNRAAADLAGFGLPDEIQGGDLVGDGAVVPGGGQLVPARRAPWGQSAQCPAGLQPLIESLGQFRGGPGLAGTQVGNVAGIARHHPGQLTHANAARGHQARQLGAEVAHLRVPGRGQGRCPFAAAMPYAQRLQATPRPGLDCRYPGRHRSEEKTIMGRAAAANGASAPPRGPFAVDQDRALAELELAWSEGGYHAFTAAGGTWCAITSAGEVLTGATPLARGHPGWPGPRRRHQDHARRLGPGRTDGPARHDLRGQQPGHRLVAPHIRWRSICGLEVGVAVGRTLEDLRGRPDLRLGGPQDRVVAWSWPRRERPRGQRPLVHPPGHACLTAEGLAVRQVPVVRGDQPVDRLRAPRSAGVGLNRRRVLQQWRGDLP